ncbi:MAG: 16S rRNA (cytosine(967)-C(5))-methyltransferase RsmB [Desulfobacterales bacterium]|nr:16S rRNA (cytosine(967)-C(5))-methyltransferase RsmB [Desulfobacterales bacterium]
MPEKDARQTAWAVLNRLDGGNKTLDRLLDDHFAGRDILPKRERALFYALVYGVLRWRGRLDWIISYFSRKPIHKIDPKILNLLRLGLFQITNLDKVPTSAAVNTSVEMAKSVAAPWVAGFVNANLRKMAREHQNVPFPEISSRPVPSLAAIKSFPEWLIQRWVQRFGVNETAALCDAINLIPPITLRANTLKSDRQGLMTALGHDAEEIRKTDHAPDGVSLRHPTKPIAEMPSFQQGWFQVQDEAAQLVVSLVDPQPGERILDSCAGLGGKTGHLAQLMKNRGEIIALDVDDSKLQKTGSEMSRLGVTIVKTLNHDLSGILTCAQVGMFDRVLVDAPCSGLGVLRRNPDTKWSSSEEDLKRLGARQIRFLENLQGIVKPSGILAYSVCSTESEENEDVIKAFLNNHENFVIDDEPGGLPREARGCLDRGYFKTFPHRNSMDGFFSVRLRRVT